MITWAFAWAMVKGNWFSAHGLCIAAFADMVCVVSIATNLPWGK